MDKGGVATGERERGGRGHGGRKRGPEEFGFFVLCKGQLLEGHDLAQISQNSSSCAWGGKGAAGRSVKRLLHVSWRADDGSDPARRVESWG